MVNVVGLEDYVQGVVAGEMPHSWPIEALKAQAVAARSYALKNLLKGKPYDLYSDVAEPGLRGHRGGAAGVDRGGPRDGRTHRHVRGRGRCDVLLLVVGRQDGERR